MTAIDRLPELVDAGHAPDNDRPRHQHEPLDAPGRRERHLLGDQAAHGGRPGGYALRLPAPSPAVAPEAAVSRSRSRTRSVTSTLTLRTPETRPSTSNTGW